jgi:hypothetical protein
MNAPDDLEVDHIDHDGLNNRRSNLRFATHAENCRNRRLPANSTTKVKGVTRDLSGWRYLAKIMLDGKTRYLGTFDSPHEAGTAYDLAAVELHGEFALTNAQIRAQAESAHDNLVSRFSAVRSEA